MTHKGKRGASAWQVAAVMFGVLIFMIVLSTHTAAEITGTPSVQQIKAALLTSDLEPETGIPRTDPEQQTDENDYFRADDTGADAMNNKTAPRTRTSESGRTAQL